MIARRLGALVVAAGLIAGAWLVRDRVIDADGGGDGDDEPTRPAATGELVCITELADVCESLDGDLEVTVEPAGDTLDRLAVLPDGEAAPAWLTVEPFPAMLDELRINRRLDPIAPATTSLASSPITLVLTPERTEDLVSVCGDPVEWRCLGNAAGGPWSDLGGEADDDTPVRPAFAADPDSATGLLGLGQAVAGYFGTGSIDVDGDPDFLPWIQRLLRAVPLTSMSSDTAIETIQVRRGALDVAVGPEAALVETNRGDLVVQYAEPMLRADVVLAVTRGADVDEELAAALRGALTDAGWEAPAAQADPLPTARSMLRIRTLWNEVVA